MLSATQILQDKQITLQSFVVSFKVELVRQHRQCSARLVAHTKQVQYAEGKLVESLDTSRGDKDKSLDSFGCCSDEVTSGNGVGLLWPITAFPPMQYQDVML